ncbi:MAG: hypothetical protein IPJ40_04410 [Saprospirales bacterium]|nr:hypothetical protein [Saprospirales bacterium]
MVGPIFKGNETLVEELQKKPYDVEIHAEFRHMLRKAFEYNPELEKNIANTLDELVEQAKISNTVIIKKTLCRLTIREGGDFRGRRLL